MSTQEMERMEEVMERLTSDLAVLAGDLKAVMAHSELMLRVNQSWPGDMQRDGEHLFARVEAMAHQLEDTLETMARLRRRSLIEGMKYMVMTPSEFAPGARQVPRFEIPW